MHSAALLALLAAAAAVSAPVAQAAPIPKARSAAVAVIDNRHYTPADALSPSAVLATPRPIVTTYLMGLADKGSVPVPVRGRRGGGRGAAGAAAVVPIRTHDAHDETEVVMVDAGVEAAFEAAVEAAIEAATAAIEAAAAKAEADYPAKAAATAQPEPPASLRMEARPHHDALPVELAEHAEHAERPKHAEHPTEIPCSYAQMRRDYNDMVVISLVAVFLLVIVAVEVWEASGERASDDARDAPVGAIQLPDDRSPEKCPSPDPRAW